MPAPSPNNRAARRQQKRMDEQATARLEAAIAAARGVRGQTPPLPSLPCTQIRVRDAQGNESDKPTILVAAVLDPGTINAIAVATAGAVVAALGLAPTPIPTEDVPPAEEKINATE